MSRTFIASPPRLYASSFGIALAAIYAAIPIRSQVLGKLVSQIRQSHSGAVRQWASPGYQVSNWRDYNLGVAAEHQNAGKTSWLRQTFQIPAQR
jgi:hypothetical protein